MTVLDDWTHGVTDLPETGLDRERTASAAEREAIARELDLLSCDRFVLAYRLMPLGGGRIHLTGTLKADVVQRCVVSLDPVPARLTQRLDVEFWPRKIVAQQVEGETEILSGPEIEPVENGVLNVGRVAFEVLSGSLDPYPRAQGAAFEWSDPRDTQGSEGERPFAALSRLKRES